MKEKNNFEELEGLNLVNSSPLSKNVKKEVLGVKSLFTYLGSLVDLCLPKFFDVFLTLFSSHDDSKKKREEK